MIVYVLEGGYDYEPGLVLGVFSSFAEAERIVTESATRGGKDSMVVYEFEVGVPEAKSTTEFRKSKGDDGQYHWKQT